MQLIKELLFNEKVDDKHNLSRGISGCCSCSAARWLPPPSSATCMTGGNTQGRVQDSQALGLQGYLNNIVSSVKQVFDFFLPGTYITYFHGERVMYSLFLLCAALSAVLVVWLFSKQQLWKRPLGCFPVGGRHYLPAAGHERHRHRIRLGPYPDVLCLPDPMAFLCNGGRAAVPPPGSAQGSGKDAALGATLCWLVL